MVLKYYKINIQIETSWNRIIVKKSFLRVLRLKSKFMVFISFIIHKTEVISRQTYTITRFYDSKKSYKYTRRQWYLFINQIISFPYFLWQNIRIFHFYSSKFVHSFVTSNTRHTRCQKMGHGTYEVILYKKIGCPNSEPVQFLRYSISIISILPFSKFMIYYIWDASDKCKKYLQFIWKMYKPFFASIFLIKGKKSRWHVCVMCSA